ncbi:MAG: hypothetical protein MHMPM18_000388 [Marteilia pararefringens]
MMRADMDHNLQINLPSYSDENKFITYFINQDRFPSDECLKIKLLCASSSWIFPLNCDLWNNKMNSDKLNEKEKELYVAALYSAYSQFKCIETDVFLYYVIYNLTVLFIKSESNEKIFISSGDKKFSRCLEDNCVDYRIIHCQKANKSITNQTDYCIDEKKSKHRFFNILVSFNWTNFTHFPTLIANFAFKNASINTPKLTIKSIDNPEIILNHGHIFGNDCKVNYISLEGLMTHENCEKVKQIMLKDNDCIIMEQTSGLEIANSNILGQEITLKNEINNQYNLVESNRLNQYIYIHSTVDS